MLDEILASHNPDRFTDLLSQLPDDLAGLVRTSQYGLAKALGLCPVDIVILDNKPKRLYSKTYGESYSIMTFIQYQ